MPFRTPTEVSSELKGSTNAQNIILDVVAQSVVLVAL